MNFKEWLSWVTTSSNDPTQTALTFKAILVGALPIITTVASVACGTAGLCLDASLFPSVIDWAYNSVVAMLTIVSLIMGAVGIGRKIWLGRWAHPAA